MKDLVEFIVKALVDKPEEVQVVEVPGETLTVIEVRVAEEDAGKVIGKEGRIVNSLRTLVKAAGAKEMKRINVEIITKGEK